LNQEGLHYGFPYCYEEDLVDPTYNQQGNCDKYVGSSQVLGFFFFFSLLSFILLFSFFIRF